MSEVAAQDQWSVSLEGKLLARLSIGGPNECWEWKGGRHSEGYGSMKEPKTRKTLLVHRVAYALWKGDIPDGLTIDHLCRNRICANPKHLEAVTSGENVLRGETLTAQNAAKTRCVNGHDFDSENTLFSGGRRYCRACTRIRMRAFRARRKK